MNNVPPAQSSKKTDSEEYDLVILGGGTGSTNRCLDPRKQHHRIMKTQPISFLSGLIVAIAVPVILNAASLSWNPRKIAKDNGIVLAEETAKPAPKARMNVDSNGVVLKGYDPVAYFTRHQAVKGNPAIQIRSGGAIYYFVSVADKVAFSKNPSRYVPQYGGFCAYHLSKVN